MAFSSGSRVGPYEVVDLLGAGGMGEVYRAHDHRLARDIAVKIIRRALVFDTPDATGHQDDTGNGDAIDRLLREATLASALNHPNIVTIYETGVVGRDRYVAMELVEGATLRKIAAPGIPLERSVGIARQIAEALAVAHSAHIVHRDIKPDNVMVRPDGYVKLLDFGLARLHGRPVAAGSTGPLTAPGLIIGTVGYMAPEQARGETVAPEADVFAFGVLLYELVTGRHPFLAASQLGTLHALMWETPEPPSLLNADVPRALDQLILEMLHKDPRLRPGAGEVLYRLAMANDASVATALSSMSVSRSTRTSRTVVGRDLEMDALLHEFERARQGHGRTVVLSAEAGFGKTTLLDAFVRLLEERGDPVRVGRGRCSERLAGSEAYLPVLEVLDSLQRNDQLGSLSRLIRALAPSWYVQIMPASNNESSAARLAADTAGGSQERLKREISTLVDEISRMHPLVLCVDDVHWADLSTTDLLGYLARRIEDRSILLVVTCRPSALAQGHHAFLPLKHDLVAHGMAREIRPGYLDEPAIARYLSLQFADHNFPSSLASVIHQRTEGHPLFVADLLRDLRRRQVLRQQDGRWIVAEDLAAVEREMPESVRSLVQRKMDALDETDRRLLAAASLQGIDFDTVIVSTTLDTPEDEVEDRLERLEREHALVRFVDEWESPDRRLTLRYRFAHHVYHNAFDRILRATRRAALSRRMADLLIGRLCDQPCDCAADIALLLESAREPVRAAEFWNRAARNAARLYAHDETTRLAQRGLALLEKEPPSPERAAAELDLQMTYGLAIKTSQGYAIPEVGRAYGRARELCRQVKDPGRVIPVLIGLSAHHVVSGEITTSRDVGLEMLDLFNRLGDPNLQMLGQWSLGAALFHLGELEVAHDHLMRGLELYDPTFHEPRVWEVGIDPGIFCRCELSRTLTLLGYPDQGLACAQEAVARARELAHPQTLAFGLLFTIMVHLARREPVQVRDLYEELSALCRQHGIAQELQWATPLCGRALVDLGDVVHGLDLLSQGLEAHLATRSTLLRPYYFALYAGALLRAGKLDAAQAALDESGAVADATSQHAYDAEHRRLQAEVHRAHGDQARAEERYVESLSIARAQGARWLELRAARGYAAHLIAAERPDEARRALEICEWFTEGRGTLDFMYADGLLKTI
jgi:serine/threonine protein kinase/predicted ATPase